MNEHHPQDQPSSRGESKIFGKVYGTTGCQKKMQAKKTKTQKIYPVPINSFN